MKKVLAISIILMLVFTFGCSKKEKAENETPPVKQEEVSSKTPGQKMKVASVVDPVSKKVVDPKTAMYKYNYKGIDYYFESMENLETFKKSPEKFIQE